MFGSQKSHAALRRSGFTLVELLVVITIIGILIGMLLPAVNSARESGRNIQCKNNLKQLGLAVLAHESSQGFFPTGGWGWFWVGDPDRGYGTQQPGGWIYTILPNTEMTNVHDLGRTGNAQAKKAAILQMVGTPLSFTNCPTRRRPALFTMASGATTIAYNSGGVNATNLQVARTDYAVNCGNVQGYDQYGPGPDQTKGADTMAANGSVAPSATAAQLTYFATSRNLASIAATQAANFQSYSGISFELSTIRKDDVTDGLSSTLLLGEKYLASSSYGTGTLGADNENQYVGFDNDIGRTTYRSPMQDRWGADDSDAFGSAHPNAANFVLCDGSVITVNYQVNPAMFKSLGMRSGRPVIVDMSKL
jgi:prepilin-type N-terminal cleavage/methylation domain-containing protein/prepilin-type processing-associated H-X9-DG protein